MIQIFKNIYYFFKSIKKNIPGINYVIQNEFINIQLKTFSKKLPIHLITKP